MVDTPESGGGASHTTEPAVGTSAATDVSLREFVALDKEWAWRFMEERDRRYAEVMAERDKALIIQAANQAYRDEKANDLREQIARERGEYASKGDLVASVDTINATLKPLVEYVASQQGARQGGLDQRSLVAWGVAVIGGLVALYFAFN